MIRAGEIIKTIRKERGLSQWKMAQMSKVSFRHLQRVENNESDITLQSFNKLLDQFDIELAISTKEPNWKLLCVFGLPLNFTNAPKNKPSYVKVEHHLVLAAKFLIENIHNTTYCRHFDATKALLLALKIHYPQRYLKLSQKISAQVLDQFNLDIIQGRHIKLRNICLSRM